MKPTSERIKIYFSLIVAGIALILMLLLTGYDYSRSKGFFSAGEREAMGVVEALSKLVEEFFWYLIALTLVISIIEFVISMIEHYRNRGAANSIDE